MITKLGKKEMTWKSIVNPTTLAGAGLGVAAVVAAHKVPRLRRFFKIKNMSDDGFWEIVKKNEGLFKGKPK